MNSVSVPVSASISVSNSQTPVAASRVTVSQSQSVGAVSSGGPSVPITRVTAAITSPASAAITSPASSSIPSQPVTQPVSMARRGYPPVSLPELQVSNKKCFGSLSHAPITLVCCWSAFKRRNTRRAGSRVYPNASGSCGRSGCSATWRTDSGTRRA